MVKYTIGFYQECPSSWYLPRFRYIIITIMEYSTAYSEVLLNCMLGLTEGDGLSINSDIEQLDFATELAQTACEITRQQVNVVAIDSGVPKDVLPFTPVEHDQLLSNPTVYALLRLDNERFRREKPDVSPETIIKDFSMLQKVGNLAPPQLDKTMAPWAVAPVPSDSWAKSLFGDTANEQQLYKALAPIFKLDSVNPAQAWREQMALINHRTTLLNRYDFQRLRIEHEETKFSIRFARSSQWNNGIVLLDSGRWFIPHLPLERVTLLPDYSTMEGVLTASGSFKLLGETVEQARLVCRNGKVVETWAEQGLDVLNLACSFDEGSGRIGEVSLVDEGNEIGRFGYSNSYIGFDENATGSVLFGMGEASHIENLYRFDNLEDVRLQTGCNISDLRFRFPFGGPLLTVEGETPSGEIVTIIENGVFIL